MQDRRKFQRFEPDGELIAELIVSSEVDNDVEEDEEDDEEEDEEEDAADEDDEDQEGDEQERKTETFPLSVAYPRENVCSICRTHIGWIMHELGEVLALDRCDNCQ